MLYIFWWSSVWCLYIDKCYIFLRDYNLYHYIISIFVPCYLFWLEICCAWYTTTYTFFGYLLLEISIVFHPFILILIVLRTKMSLLPIAYSLIIFFKIHPATLCLLIDEFFQFILGWLLIYEGLLMSFYLLFLFVLYLHCLFSFVYLFVILLWWFFMLLFCFLFFCCFVSCPYSRFVLCGYHVVCRTYLIDNKLLFLQTALIFICLNWFNSFFFLVYF